MHAELPIVSFICATLVLIPLPWHWRAGTVPTISIVVWLFLVNIINGVNSIIWADNVTIVASMWCDITTKIMIGSNVSVPAAIFCLCVHLERVSSLRQVRTSHADKRRRQIIDGVICVGVPIIYMALHYIVQGHRFDIIEVFGCRPTIYSSVASIFLIWVPPLAFCVASCVIAGLALGHFWTRRVNFTAHLQGSSSALTPSRYFRLMCMAVVEMFWALVITSFNMWFTLSDGLRPWLGWANVHFEFSHISLFPLIVISSKQLTFTFILWWTIPVSSVLFFAFFSFGQDAMSEYRTCIRWIRTHILRLPDTPLSKGCMSLLPSFRARGSVSPTSPSFSCSKFKDSKCDTGLPSPIPPPYRQAALPDPATPLPYRHSSLSDGPSTSNSSSCCTSSLDNVEQICHDGSSDLSYWKDPSAISPSVCGTFVAST